MKIFNSINIPKNYKVSALAIGNFDGVHKGHQKIFRETKKFAKRKKTKFGVLTFTPLPVMFFYKNIKNFRLASEDQKIKLFKKHKVDFVINIKFNKNFSQINAKDFIKKIIYKKINPQLLSVSNNFKFGKKRKGDVNLLKKFSNKYDYQLLNIDPFKYSGKIVSSTRIRKCLKHGNIDLANKLLSRTWFIEGQVKKGKKIGRKLGYRTCNIKVKNYVLPKIGIYAVKISIGDKKNIYGGVAYLGSRPTFGGKKIFLETNIFGVKKSLYKKRLRVYFLKFLRGDRKFKNPSQLIRQMNKDVIFAKKRFKNEAIVMSKEDINLPKTSFSMKANLPNKEPEILKTWEKLNLYKKLRESRKGKEKFVLHDGPPYANGHIHMGTALNKILKDMVTKFHQMDGKDSVYVPGWDCHGLPIEWKIEEQYKKNKKNKDEVPIKNFRSECREFAGKWIDIHIKEFSRLGVKGDWKNYYSTMSFDAEAQIVRELGKFLLDGSLYQGYKPILWSTVEKTALADAEVDYKDHTSNTIYTGFKVKSSKIDILKNCEVIIWTTTPWTIPANRALAYNKDLDYSIIGISPDENFDYQKQKRREVHHDVKIVVATKLVDRVVKECVGEIPKDYIHYETFKGHDFKGTICSHPFENLGYKYDVPMLEGQFVTLEQGTGIVHCAPSHGPDDFNLCLKHGIRAVNTIDDNGYYTKNIPLFEGTHIFKADQIIIEKLKEEKKLLGSGKLTHSYPHSWRSKAPLVHRATQQWFISMEKKDLRKKALKAIDDTAFYPARGKERIRSMIETRPDWCISRQRVWGVPLPLFVSKKTNEPLRDPEVIENIAKIYEREGADCWFDDDPQKFLGKKYKKEDYIKSTDICEVWFDSGSTHSFVLEKRKDLKWPASMYLEGSDQHRGWFHSSLLESCGTRGRAPFDSILSHGFVVDGKGLKMSKSTGNIIAPEEVLKKYGADILRAWVAASDYAEDLRLDYSILEQHAESYRKIRNTFRFLLGNLRDQKLNFDLNSKEIDKWSELERFMLHQIFILNKNFNDYFREYNFHKLYRELLNFCSLDLSAFYFDIRKDVLYCDEIKSPQRQMCINLLSLILDILLKWFAPILSFTTEEIFQTINQGKNSSIHLEVFPDIPLKWENKKLFQKWNKLKIIRNVANAAIETKRSSKKIGSSLEADVEIYLDKEYLKLVNGVNLSEYFITSKASAKPMINDDKLFQLDEVDNIKILVTKAKGKKCSRCWKILENACTRNNCGLKD